MYVTPISNHNILTYIYVHDHFSQRQMYPRQSILIKYMNLEAKTYRFRFTDTQHTKRFMCLQSQFRIFSMTYLWILVSQAIFETYNIIKNKIIKNRQFFFNLVSSCPIFFKNIQYFFKMLNQVIVWPTLSSGKSQITN